VFVAPLSWLRDLHLSNGAGRRLRSSCRSHGAINAARFPAETDNALLDHAPRRAKLIEGSCGVPALLTLSCAELAATCRAGEQDPDEVIAAWSERQNLAPENVGPSPELVPFLRELDNVKPDDFDLLKKFCAMHGPAPARRQIPWRFRSFRRLGSDFIRRFVARGVRITALGRLVKRSLSRQ